MLYAALGQRGYKETSVNKTKFGAAYGVNGVAWCAMFVSWTAAEAGILTSDGGIDSFQTKLGTSADGVVPAYKYCLYGIKAYGNSFHTTASGYIPMAGDSFFMGKNGGDHTGLVLAYANGYVYTVEGNADDAVKVLKRPLSTIYGFGSNGGTSYGIIPTNIDGTKGGTS
jgi:hypothetical protein